MDEPELLESSMEANVAAFWDLADKKDFTAVRKFREINESIFQSFDQKYISLCHDDQALVRWANRMQAVRKHLDELDRNLAFEGKRQFNWASVVTAVGILNAYRVASEQTLALNEPS